MSYCKKCGNKINDKYINAGFILSLISIIAWLLPFIGYPVSICGIVFSSKGLKESNKALAGLIISIVCLIFTLGNSVAGLLLWYKSL